MLVRHEIMLMCLFAWNLALSVIVGILWWRHDFGARKK